MKSDGPTLDSLRGLVGPTVTVVALPWYFRAAESPGTKIPSVPKSLSPVLHLLSSDCELRREVFESKSRLEGMLGDEVSCFAYPYGDIDARVRAAGEYAGYRFAFTVNPGRNLWDDRLALKRIELAEQDSILSLSMKTPNAPKRS
jgi:hypothetical protein